jgi:GT2 family glycosyltransferase
LANENFPLVYCILLNWNGRDLLLETLDSVTKLRYPNFKIVIVDNGSIDGSQDAVRKAYPQLTLIENGANLGFGGGNNVGMEYALKCGAEWIILLNSDIAVDNDMLSELMKVAVTDNTIGVLTPKIYHFADKNVLWYAGGAVNYWSGIVSHRGLRETDRGQYDRVEDTEYISGCAMLLKRNALERAGMFDPAYFPAYSEDADLSVRIKRLGYRLVYVPQAKLWHKISSSSGGGLTPFKTALKVEHNLIFFRRYARWYHWLTIPFSVAGMAIVFVGKELLKGNFKVIAALARGFVKALGRLLAILM